MTKKDGLLNVWLLVLIDIVLIGVGLLIFAYFHHVREVPQTPVVSASPRPTPSIDPLASQEIPTSIDPLSSPTPDQSALSWREKYADKFLTEGDPIVTEDSYQSQNINISLKRYDENGVVYFVQEIFLADIGNISSALAKDTYGKGVREAPVDIAAAHNAICAITGDYYGARDEGIIARNGVLYRNVPFRDVCVLYYDGVMKTFSKDGFDTDAQMQNGAYQIWSFGPMLLDENGQAMTEFDSDVPRANPRSAIGYAEPGHYFFVVVDGRDDAYSLGMTLSELSKLFYDLGCKAAYNLDGGQTAEMVFNDALVNSPPSGGRKMSDIVMIGEIG